LSSKDPTFPQRQRIYHDRMQASRALVLELGAAVAEQSERLAKIETALGVERAAEPSRLEEMMAELLTALVPKAGRRAA
jgi:hypothetical protein